MSKGRPVTTANPGNIKKFEIFSNVSGESVDLSGGVAEFSYYESILSNNYTANVVVMDTGFEGKGSSRELNEMISKGGVIDALPMRGGERCLIEVEDAQGNVLNFQPGEIYINRVRDNSIDSQKEVFQLDLFSRDAVSNHLTRVIKRYEGKINLHVEDILKNVLGTPMPLNIDETIGTGHNADYNFIGNDRKPFYICTWLAQKSVPPLTNKGGGSGEGTNSAPPEGEGNKAAGYLFYQTHDEFCFKSIDLLFDQTPVKKYIYHDVEKIPEGYDDNIMQVTVDSDVDIHNNLSLGMYHNRSIFFDFWAMNYVVREYNVDWQESGINPAGPKFVGLIVDEKLRESPSRLMSHVLDVGTHPDKVGDEQLDYWKQDPYKPNYDAANRMVQGVMRYNELFTVKIDITIPGDFSLRAGQLVECDFPKLSQTTEEEETRGIYMISSVCHKLTPRDTFTSLTLVRDAFDKKTGLNRRIS